MIEVIVFAEGHTEEKFINTVIKENLNDKKIFVKAQLIKTSKENAGGALTYERVMNDIVKTLKDSKSNNYFTTFFDLYRIHNKFPGFAESKKQNSGIKKAQIIQDAFHKDIIKRGDFREDRFFPHIQPYEFEALLLADAQKIAEVDPILDKHVSKLHNLKKSHENPEEINGDNPPSKRLCNLKIGYNKVLHGPDAAKLIGLSKLCEECKHFHQWYKWLNNLVSDVK
jgi:hypothetical protein